MADGETSTDLRGNMVEADIKKKLTDVFYDYYRVHGKYPLEIRVAPDAFEAYERLLEGIPTERRIIPACFVEVPMILDENLQSGSVFAV